MCDSVTDSFTLTAVAPPIERIEIRLDASEHIIGTDPNHIMDIGIYPESSRDYYIDDIVVSSSNVSVARVFKTNSYPPYILYALEEGTTTVTATLDSNPQITDSKDFRVYYDGTSNPDTPDPSEPQPPEVIPVESYIINDLPATMHTLFNPTHQISVTVNPSGATYWDYYFESSDPKVATIDENGLITAHKPGQTYISVKSWNYDVEAGFWVDVTGPTISYNTPENNCISVGETFTVSTEPLTTISAQTDGIIRVNGDGTITGLTVGKTVVEVSHTGFDYFEEFELVVTKDFVITGIPTGDIYPGEVILPNIEGEIASSDTFVWYSSDSSIASFDKNEIDGVVLTCHAPGDVYVGFTIGNSGIGKEVLLTVDTPEIIGVTLLDDAGGNAIYEGETKNFWVHIETDPANVNTSYLDIDWDFGTDFNYTKTEQNKCITQALNASADQTNGTKITLTIADQEYTFYRLVKRPEITFVNPVVDQLYVGETWQLNLDETKYANFKKWEISDTSIIDINSNNQIVALSPGNVTIKIYTKNILNDDIYVTDCIFINVLRFDIVDNPINNEIFLSGKWNLNAIVKTSEIDDILWISNNPTIATIDKNGVVIGVAEGDVTIRAEYTKNAKIFDTITITVTETYSYFIYNDTAAPTLENSIKMMAEQFYNGNENFIVPIFLNAKTTLTNAWESLGDDEKNIGYVVISTHGDPISINSDNNGTLPSLHRVDILSLSNKKMFGLVLAVCNAGHLDYDLNIANAFAKIVSGAPVIASDGTVLVHSDGTIISSVQDEYGEIKEINEYEFVKLSAQKIGVDNARTQNRGWIIYQENKQITYTDITEANLNVLLEKLYEVG